MVIVEAALVAGLLGLMIYGVVLLFLRPQDQRRHPTLSGAWRVAHYDARGETHVVLQKVSEGGLVLDEHVVASLRADDPEYDHKFLAAMSAARERQALFEAEEGA
jgi:hypothetical protein